jgi:hypothetical protein
MKLGTLKRVINTLADDTKLRVRQEAIYPCGCCINDDIELSTVCGDHIIHSITVHEEEVILNLEILQGRCCA